MQRLTALHRLGAVTVSVRCASTEAPARGSLVQSRALDAGLDRGIGKQQGMRHSSQASDPRTGQLHVRKHVLHARGSLVRPAPPVADWYYLVSALRAGAEASVPEDIFARLVRGEVLDAAAAARVREGQRLFLYELERRIGLLEDTLAEAEVKHLVLWPAVFRRAWVRLPRAEWAPSGSSRVASSGPSDALVSSSALVAASEPQGLVVYQQEVSSKSRARVAELTRVVAEWVEEEFAAAAAAEIDGTEAVPLKSARQRAEAQDMQRLWRECMRWHTQVSE